MKIIDKEFFVIFKIHKHISMSGRNVCVLGINIEMVCVFIYIHGYVQRKRESAIYQDCYQSQVSLALIKYLSLLLSWLRSRIYKKIDSFKFFDILIYIKKHMNDDTEFLSQTE